MGLRPVPTCARGCRVSEAVLQPRDHIGLKHQVHSTKRLVYKRPVPMGLSGTVRAQPSLVVRGSPAGLSPLPQSTNLLQNELHLSPCFLPHVPTPASSLLGPSPPKTNCRKPLSQRLILKASKQRTKVMEALSGDWFCLRAFVCFQTRTSKKKKNNQTRTSHRCISVLFLTDPQARN